MRYLLTIVSLLFLFQQATAQFHSQDNPLAHTFSIVARDAETGEMGVGVQSHWFSVGTTVSWARAGVGAVATQSFSNKSFGPRGLDLLEEGKSASEALAILLRDDEGREFRQVAIVDNDGNVAVHTGSKCIADAGHRTGNGFSVQANMMLTDEVWDAMADTFEQRADLPLAERIMATLKAAQEAGGDIRGKQSAAILVVKDDPDTKAWNDPMIDLRVDDHHAPLDEMERLLRVYRAYEHMSEGDLALEENDMERALAEYGAARKMFPENLEMKYWTAVTLANNGDFESAMPIFREVFDADGNWKELTRRLPAVGLLQVNDQRLREILEL